jgi:hypothetical protein
MHDLDQNSTRLSENSLNGDASDPRVAHFLFDFHPGVSFFAPCCKMQRIS